MVSNKLSFCRSEKEKFQNPVLFSPEFKWRIWEVSQRNPFLQRAVKTIKDAVSTGPQFNTAKVTLDPDTAHPRFILSEDRKTLTWGDTRQNLFNNPERFYDYPCVLGRQGFTSGRHCWEVEVGAGHFWAVGVARESVRRKGLIQFNPEVGVWAVELWGGQYRAFTTPRTALSLSSSPRRIRVYVDCTGGRVAFLDADTEAPIFTFPPASFSGERILPWFWVGRGLPGWHHPRNPPVPEQPPQEDPGLCGLYRGAGGISRCRHRGPDLHFSTGLVLWGENPPVAPRGKGIPAKTGCP
uniref:B30.2/SPRY domain-containing protein n=1 Tax=Sphenodon punctatus TaxID=8508 RepID=A0A8D0HBM1_SPHPU